MTNLPILYSADEPRNGGIAETIAAKYQPSLNAGIAEVMHAANRKAVVLRPNGGARTKQQCNDLGTPWYISDHYEGAGDRAAVDIDNYLELIAILGATRYYAIFAKHGWHNVTTEGDPFPREGWHLANHDPTPQQLAPTTKGSKMDYRQIRELGNPALFADTTGLVAERGLTPVVASLRRSGRSVKVIERRLGESAAKWATRRAAILADWDREAAANVAAIRP